MSGWFRATGNKVAPYNAVDLDFVTVDVATAAADVPITLPAGVLDAHIAIAIIGHANGYQVDVLPAVGAKVDLLDSVSLTTDNETTIVHCYDGVNWKRLV